MRILKNWKIWSTVHTGAKVLKNDGQHKRIYLTGSEPFYYLYRRSSNNRVQSYFQPKIETAPLEGCVYLQQQGQQLYLGMLIVAPDLQGKGIGKQLLQAGEIYGRKINCTSILMSLSMYETNYLTGI